MVAPIEGLDFLDRRVRRVHDLEEAEVFSVDQFSFQELLDDECRPVVPIVATRRLQADDWLRIALADLREGENFKSFIVCAEAAGKEGDSIGFFLEHQLASEKVFEGDQFGIVGDRGVGSLFKGQHDVHAEAVFPPGAFLRGPHDAVGASGNDHVAGFHDLLGELMGQAIVGIVRRRAGRAEDADFPPVAIAMEHTKWRPEDRRPVPPAARESAPEYHRWRASAVGGVAGAGSEYPSSAPL